MSILDKLRALVDPEKSTPRLPAEMPTDWFVHRFSRAMAQGHIVRDGEEPVAFGVETWRSGGGSWNHDPNAVYSSPDEWSEWPQKGEPVRVQWRTSSMGQTVPALVEATDRVLPPSVPKRTFRAWLAAVKKATGELRGVTYRSLMKEFRRAEPDEPVPWDYDGAYTTDEFTDLLLDMYVLGEDSDSFAQHTRWIYMDDHRWGREQAAQVFPELLGLPAGAVSPDTDDLSLPDYAILWNREAARVGVPKRLFSPYSSHNQENHVIICLEPSCYASLVKDGFLNGDEDWPLD